MSSIKSYKDLLEEKQRLKLLLHERQIAIKAEFEVVKAKLKPVHTVLEFVEKITTRDKHNPLVNTGIEVGVNFLLRKVVLRNAGWIAKILMPVFVRNYLSHEVEENAGWINKIGRFLKKKLS